MKTWLIILVIVALLGGAEGAEKRYRPSIRISVIVSGRSGLDATIKSYLTREFRRLDDVIITDTDPLYRIGCVAMKNYSQGGQFTGYTLSFVVTSTMPATLTTNLASSQLSAADAQRIREWNSNLGVLVDHKLQTCPPDAVQKVCGELVAQFDGELIESARQFAQRFIEATAPESADPSAPPTTPFNGITVHEVTEEPPPPKNLRAETPTQAVPASTFAVSGLRPGDTLNVRSGPGMSFPSLQSLPIGYSGIEVVGESVMNDRTEWVQIAFDGHRGWVRKKYLKPE